MKLDLFELKDMMMSHEIGQLDPWLDIGTDPNGVRFKIFIPDNDEIFEDKTFHASKIFTDELIQRRPINFIFTQFLDDVLEKFKIHDVGEI